MHKMIGWKMDVKNGLGVRGEATSGELHGVLRRFAKIATAKMKKTDADHESYYSLDLEHFRKGLEQYLNSESSTFCILPEGRIDPGMIDAVAADQIIQYALFDEIVYG